MEKTGLMMLLGDPRWGKAGGCPSSRPWGWNSVLERDTTSGFGTTKCFENPIHGRRSPENSLSQSQNHPPSSELGGFDPFSFF